MKSINLFLLTLSLVSLSLIGCEGEKGDKGESKQDLKSIQELKGILENQKDKSTVLLGTEESEFTKLYFLRNDAMHPRLLYIKTGDDMLVKNLKKYWEVNNFSTSYYKNNGVFLVRYKNSIDSAVLFSKYYLYNIQKIDPKKKIRYDITDVAVIQ